MYSQVQEEAVEASTKGDDATDIESAAGDTAPAVIHRPSSLAVLKAEIARAMQAAADRERERIDAGMGEEETAQVEKIFSRASVEAAELSRHADEDVSHVNAGYKDEVKRIRGEADRQIDDRRAGLEQSLTHHGSLIEAEIESVHIAVQGYRGSLNAFFDRLAVEKDPSAIARLAGDLPDPPDLDDVRAEARSAAMEALEQGSADTGEPVEPVDTGATNGNGRNGRERDLVPVMDREAADGQTGSLSGTAIVATAAVATVDAEASQDEPAPATESPDGGAAETPAEVSASADSVGSRLVRAFTKWTSPSGAAEDR
jgi:hypothetical protein